MPAQADDAPGAAGSPERRDSADFSPAAGQAQRAAGGFEAETPSEQWGSGVAEAGVAGSGVAEAGVAEPGATEPGARPEDDGSHQVATSHFALTCSAMHDFHPRSLTGQSCPSDLVKPHKFMPDPPP